MKGAPASMATPASWPFMPASVGLPASMPASVAAPASTTTPASATAISQTDPRHTKPSAQSLAVAQVVLHAVALQR